MREPELHRGATLLETAIALAVFSIAIVALLQAGVFSLAGIVERGRLNQAAAEAQKKAEEIMLFGYDSAVTEDFSTEDFGEGTVEVSQVQAGLKRVRISIHEESGDKVLYVLVTYVRQPLTGDGQ